MEHKDKDGSTTAENLASLHLAYQSVKVLVFRALLRPFNIMDHSATEAGHNDEWQAARDQIRKTVSAEADAALTLVSSLRPAHYQAFWVPFITHEQHTGDHTISPEEYTQRRASLDRGRTTFRLHAKSLDMVRFALLRIDAVFWIGWERVLGFP
ncbi:hypothetical protein BBP40_002566 [Aspergillus hancockii]|nr:hypothetical protein BBP40_002566 [Aspergillus hancockii]